MSGAQLSLTTLVDDDAVISPTELVHNVSALSESDMESDPSLHINNAQYIVSEDKIVLDGDAQVKTDLSLLGLPDDDKISITAAQLEDKTINLLSLPLSDCIKIFSQSSFGVSKFFAGQCPSCLSISSVEKLILVELCGLKDVLQEQTPKSDVPTEDLNESTDGKDRTVESTSGTGKRKRGRPRKGEEKNKTPRTPLLSPPRKLVKPTKIEDKYKCQYCQREFLRATSLKNHEENICILRLQMKKLSASNYEGGNESEEARVAEEGEEFSAAKRRRRTYTCSECNIVVKSVPALNAHMKEDHPKLTSFSCTECSKSFSNVAKLESHRKNNHDEPKFFCELCKLAFIKKLAYERHMSDHNGKKCYKCIDCGQGFTNGHFFRNHTIGHARLKPFRCHICWCGFHEEAELKSHECPWRLRKKPVVCEVCGEEKLNEKFMSKHINMRHSDASKAVRRRLVKDSDEIFIVRPAVESEGIKPHKTIQFISQKTNLAEKQTSDLGSSNAIKAKSGNEGEVESIGQDFDLEKNSNLQDSVQAICHVCGLCFESEPQLKAHFKTHSKDDKSLWKKFVSCHACNKEFSCRNYLIKHHYAEHVQARAHICCQCGNGWDELLQFESHVCSQQMLHYQLYKCTECNKHFLQRFQYQNHMVHTHPNVSAPFHCYTCNIDLPSAKAFRCHQVVHLPLKYFCELCGVGFPKRVQVVNHVKRHSLKRDHACEYCHKLFISSVHLKRHRLTHFPKTVNCVECPALFYDQYSLKSHVLFKHSDHRPFKCLVCTRRFKTRISLKVHSYTHTENRPFKCSHCDSKFKNRSAVKLHEKIHLATSKAWQCSDCQKNFKSEAAALRHYRSVHENVCLYQCNVCLEHFKHSSKVLLHKCNVHGIDDGVYLFNGTKKRREVPIKVEGDVMDATGVSRFSAGDRMIVESQIMTSADVSCADSSLAGENVNVIVYGVDDGLKAIGSGAGPDDAKVDGEIAAGVSNSFMTALEGHLTGAVSGDIIPANYQTLILEDGSQVLVQEGTPILINGQEVILQPQQE